MYCSGSCTILSSSLHTHGCRTQEPTNMNIWFIKLQHIRNTRILKKTKCKKNISFQHIVQEPSTLSSSRVAESARAPAAPSRERLVEITTQNLSAPKYKYPLDMEQYFWIKDIFQISIISIRFRIELHRNQNNKCAQD